MDAPWVREQGLDAVVRRWLDQKLVREDFVANAEFAPSGAQHAPMPADLPRPLIEALRARGIEELYAHQAQAFELARRGRNWVVATPTASGKSLCFHLPVLTALAENPQARALYLFPTKALGRDQEASLRALMAASNASAAGASGEGKRGAVVYDGDTPGDARRAARERAGIILTNPDMLHAGILPHHASWASLFSQLRYVIVDELHVYRGVFGSHLANVLRRLQRICRFHGSSPTFLCATATIGNPQQHAAKLLGVPDEEVALLQQSGAPRGSRRVLIYNPPVVNPELGIRGSCPKRAVRFAADLLRARVPTILFGGSRNGVETMLKYLRESTEEAGIKPDAIAGYRGGYLPEVRRRIEAGLRNGDVLGVVATNALELGVDIGDLDAVVCAGYPGSVAATWQRFGRAGRRASPSIAVLVASSAPIDQYLARVPDYVLGSPVEEARIDPNNVEILVAHLKCAAFECPFEDGERFGELDVQSTREALTFLADSGLVHEVKVRDKRRFHWSSDAYPANHVPLRSVSWDNVVIVEQRAEEEDRTLGELDWPAAQTMLHEQAIYQHDGTQYQVERFDHENHKAYVRLVEPDYYTEAMVHKKVSVLEELGRQLRGRATMAHGEVQVVEKVVGYKKIKFHTHENVGYGDVHLPDLELHTTSVWLTLSELLLAAFARQGVDRSALVDALRGAGRALKTVSSVALMCDPHDLAMAVEDKPTAMEEEVFAPTLHLYDATAGGVGLAPRIYEQQDTLLTRAQALVHGCPCTHGCPSCVGPVIEQAGDRARKAQTIELLQQLLGS